MEQGWISGCCAVSGCLAAARSCVRQLWLCEGMGQD